MVRSQQATEPNRAHPPGKGTSEVLGMRVMRAPAPSLVSENHYQLPTEARAARRLEAQPRFCAAAHPRAAIRDGAVAKPSRQMVARQNGR